MPVLTYDSPDAWDSEIWTYDGAPRWRNRPWLPTPKPARYLAGGKESRPGWLARKGA